jgi:hypothetical protein
MSTDPLRRMARHAIDAGQHFSMSGEEGTPKAVSNQVPAPKMRTTPALLREGSALVIGATAIGALLLGTLAVGAMVIAVSIGVGSMIA